MKRVFYFLSMLLFISCGNSANSPEFIEATKGRYLFNSNDVIEISYASDTMKVKWRGQEIIPLKIGDSTFFLQEVNEKFVFVTKPKVYIQLVENKRFKGRKQILPKLKSGEKTPGEYFQNQEYEKALESYLAIQKIDSLDKTIEWWSLNNEARRYFEGGQREKAYELFKINIALYPNNPAAYRNYGFVLMEAKDTANAIVNYRKALAINPDDHRALSFFERLQKSTND